MTSTRDISVLVVLLIILSCCLFLVYQQQVRAASSSARIKEAVRQALIENGCQGN